MSLADAYTSAIVEDIDTFNDRISCNLITRHREHIILLNNPTINDEITTSPTLPLTSPPHRLDFSSAYALQLAEDAETLQDRAAVSTAWRARDAANQECGEPVVVESQSLIPGLDPGCAKAILRLHAYRSHLQVGRRVYHLFYHSRIDGFYSMIVQ
ncbi:hypothetical protein BC829DRAFT_404630 [Chytridium lagenaria]|nr:hypothetical protein BC829DRAFT_404630 [Chytridium lagenaria]